MVQHAVMPLHAVKLPLTNAVGLTLALDVVSAYDIPAYAQSSMDGYALAFKSIGDKIKVIGEAAAGSQQQVMLPNGEAIRIFTGAPVPPGADTIIVQEKARVVDGLLQIDEHTMTQGQHVRPVGSEIRKGAVAAYAGQWLTPAAIGLLAGIGVAEVAAIPMPRVYIIVTGNELQTPGLPLQYGQVFEANSATLIAALHQYGIQQVRVRRVTDNPEIMRIILADALAEADIIFMTGGVSVGDYDFTKQVFGENEVDIIFHKIRQKPGKPMLFGMKGNKPVFGLPGNPASVLTCFYEYVSFALQKMTGVCMAPSEAQMICRSAYKKPSGITHFLKAKAGSDDVTLLTGQESYKLHSFAEANCLAVIPEDCTLVNEGDLITVHKLHG